MYIDRNLMKDRFSARISETVPSIFGYRVAQRVLGTRVARWFVFKPKIPLWVNFGGFCNGKYFRTI
jgi:type II secretory pathway component GspD/PulD (secretin)